MMKTRRKDVRILYAKNEQYEATGTDIIGKTNKIYEVLNKNIKSE